MSRIPSSFGAPANQQAANSTDAVNDIDLDVFLKLMIKELQNQDPLNPLDNKDMLAQISQIREVGATDKLTETLDSVLLGQNISSATNLIGADITALSDDHQNVEGIVSRVAIDKGAPKLQVEVATKAEPSSADGNLGAGTYSYRIVWQNNAGQLEGIDLSGDKAVKTNGQPDVDQSVLLRNLPENTGPKKIYRTDATGQGDYRLVGVINDGSQGSFVDTLSDDERSNERLTQPFARSTLIQRMYQVSLNNVSAIRPPGQSDDLSTDQI
jgi:flagellar basal-body rod modification protein FlgD